MTCLRTALSKVIFPTYYKRFHCIAGLCRHTCCRDWEIDIDKASLKHFDKFPDISSKIKNGSYILEPDGRCPFLMNDGLCYQIKTYGEDIICDICREHPRFYFERDGKLYGGIGLACEEAARVILTGNEPFMLEDNEEIPSEISSFMDDIDPVSDKIDRLAPVLTSSYMRTKIFSSMEYLEDNWMHSLNKISDIRPTREDENAILEDNKDFFERFIIYMLYRHGPLKRLAGESALLVADLIIAGNEPLEAARMFSSEIEYSDINIEEAKSTFC